MFDPILLLFVLLVLLIYFLVFYETRIQQCLRNVPGRKPLPLVGNALDFPDSTKMLAGFKEYFSELGPWMKIQIGPHRLLLSSCDHKFSEFIVNSNVILDKSLDYRFFHKWLGTGLLTSTGTKWKKRRRVITPAFHFKILEQFIPIFTSTSAVLIEKLKREVGDEVVDIYDYISLLTLDIICETSMGTPVDALKQAGNQYVTSVREVSRLAMDRTVSPVKMYDMLYPLTPSYYQEKRHVAFLHSYTDSVIERRRRLLKGQPAIVVDDTETGLNRKVAFLDLLLQSTVDGRSLTREDIREEVDTFMFEGHDTTSTGISFTLYLLSQHQEVQEKVYREQVDIFGDNFDGDETYSDLQNMKYLEMVLKESMRLYPPVPIIGRELSEDVTYDGILLPKGLSVLIVIYHMHRRKEYFEDPDKFIPERFESQDWRKTSSFVYVPFSAGPRNCIGQKFAMLEMKSTISSIVRNFKLLPAPPSDAPILTCETILKSKNGVKLRLKRR